VTASRDMTATAAACLGALLTSAPLAAQADEVRYTLRIADRAQHLAEVTAEFPTAGRERLELFLPVWSPGFYRVQPYHERVVAFAATAAGDPAAPLAVERPAPNRWHIATGGAAAVRATYTLRCDRASVTENQVASGFAVFCGPATWLGEVGHLARPHVVQVVPPDGWPDVATGLPQRGGSDVPTFVARDYDWLADSPFVLGTIATLPFDVLGARHEWAQFGDPGEFDAAAMVQRLQPVASELCRTFGAVPFARYVFLAGFRRANGGLEHLDSTLLSVDRRQRPDDADFLSFVAHEYAHAFNVKRLRPVELGPFDYERPPATASLWISEGLTTWFGDLALVRAGVVTTDVWLDLVAGHVRGLQSSPGRKRQTLVDASLAVWGQSTSGVGGDPRTTISYYVKGPVVGFVLEARLRVASGGRHGLDELMRRAYAAHGGERGFTPQQFEALAAEVAGSDQRAFFDRALRSCDELDYEEALAWFGMEFVPVAGDAPPRERWRLRVRADADGPQQEHLRVLLAPSPELAAGR
jgi:predicted metalloprotease with PDZ domain